jgi:DNA topoisomerase-1
MATKSPSDAATFLRAKNEGVSIPPAWSNVVYFGSQADIIAKGTDSVGRGQRLENPAYRQRLSDENNARISRDVVPQMPRIRQQLQQQAMAGNEEAKVLHLITMTGFRIGGKGDGKSKHAAFGASTLLGDHVKVEGDTVHFDFPGKKGVRQTHSVTDPIIAQVARNAQPGQPLFNTRDSKVRDQWKSVGGHKVHDIRHVIATEQAEAALSSRIPPMPKNDRERTKLIKDVATVAASVLGNNPKQSLDTYIDPQIWEKVKVQA